MSTIELSLVILVIGILAAVAAPRFADSLRVTRLEAAAQQLAAHIRYIRAIAINEGRTASLICDNSNNTYGSDSVDHAERMGELLNVSLPEVYDSTFELTADFDSASTVSFNLEGVPYVGASPMSSGSIVLRSGSDRFRVTIATGTGQTTVERLSLTSKSSDAPAYDAPITEVTP